MWKEVLDNFLDNTDSLKVFVESVEPVLMRKDKEFLCKYRKIMDIMAYSIKEVGEDILKDEHKDIMSKIPDVEKIEGVEVDINKESNSININLKSDDIDIKPEDFKNLMNGLKYKVSNYDILYRSALMSLVVSLESMIADLFRQSFNKWPERVTKNKSLTFEEISSIGSFEEARIYIIEKEIESIMYKSFTDWCSLLKKDLSLKMDYLDSYLDELIEVIIRRNIFVHNRGIVNQIYLNKVSEKYKQGIEIGDKLTVDRRYINNAIKTVEKCGVLIISEIWLKQNRADKSVRQNIDQIAFKFMKENKWDISKNIYKMLLNEKKANNKEKLVYKINYWQSLKWLGEYEIIKNEVEKEDFSACTPDYQLCLHAIKNEYDEFFDLLNRIYGQYVGLEELKEWPVFREIRELEDYKNFIEEKELIGISN